MPPTATARPAPRAGRHTGPRTGGRTGPRTGPRTCWYGRPRAVRRRGVRPGGVRRGGAFARVGPLRGDRRRGAVRPVAATRTGCGHGRRVPRSRRREFPPGGTPRHIGAVRPGAASPSRPDGRAIAGFLLSVRSRARRFGARIGEPGRESGDGALRARRRPAAELHRQRGGTAREVHLPLGAARFGHGNRRPLGILGSTRAATQKPGAVVARKGSAATSRRGTERPPPRSAGNSAQDGNPSPHPAAGKDHRPRRGHTGAEFRSSTPSTSPTVR
jgi:hypothetical protein